METSGRGERERERERERGLGDHRRSFNKQIQRKIKIFRFLLIQLLPIVHSL